MSKLVTCEKCDGTGKLPMFAHVDNGTCFRCDGTGKALPITTRDLNTDVATIHWLLEVRGDLAYLSVFYIWEKDRISEFANTGHVHYSTYEVVGGHMISDEDMHELHRPLDEIREEYRACLKRGAVLLTHKQVDAFIGRVLSLIEHENWGLWGYDRTVAIPGFGGAYLPDGEWVPDHAFECVA